MIIKRYEPEIEWVCYDYETPYQTVIMNESSWGKFIKVEDLLNCIQDLSKNQEYGAADVLKLFYHLEKSLKNDY